MSTLLSTVLRTVIAAAPPSIFSLPFSRFLSRFSLFVYSLSSVISFYSRKLYLEYNPFVK